MVTPYKGTLTGDPLQVTSYMGPMQYIPDYQLIKGVKFLPHTGNFLHWTSTGTHYRGPPAWYTIYVTPYREPRTKDPIQGPPTGDPIQGTASGDHLQGTPNGDHQKATPKMRPPTGDHILQTPYKRLSAGEPCSGLPDGTTFRGPQTGDPLQQTP